MTSLLESLFKSAITGEFVDIAIEPVNCGKPGTVISFRTLKLMRVSGSLKFVIRICGLASEFDRLPGVVSGVKATSVELLTNMLMGFEPQNMSSVVPFSEPAPALKKPYCWPMSWAPSASTKSMPRWFGSALTRLAAKLASITLSSICQM